MKSSKIDLSLDEKSMGYSIVIRYLLKVIKTPSFLKHIFIFTKKCLF